MGKKVTKEGAFLTVFGLGNFSFAFGDCASPKLGVPGWLLYPAGTIGGFCESAGFYSFRAKTSHVTTFGGFQPEFVVVSTSHAPSPGDCEIWEVTVNGAALSALVKKLLLTSLDLSGAGCRTEVQRKSRWRLGNCSRQKGVALIRVPPYRKPHGSGAAAPAAFFSPFSWRSKKRGPPEA